LATKRPGEIPPGQWEYAIGWTLNLHSNCASNCRTTAATDLEAFALALEDKCAGNIDLSIIDWIWDEYERITPNGKYYSNLYRPTRSPNFVDAEVGCFNFWVK